MLKITISNDQGEVYVIANVLGIERNGNDVAVEDEEGEILSVSQLVKDALIWDAFSDPYETMFAGDLYRLEDRESFNFEQEMDTNFDTESDL